MVSAPAPAAALRPPAIATAPVAPPASTIITLAAAAGERAGGMELIRRGRLISAALMLLALVFGWYGAGQAASPSVGQPQPAAAGNDDADLATLLDLVVSRGMADGHIPGAAIVVVQDGAVAFSKGYGVADGERTVPVSPDAAVFRAMSVSKLFTATGIMQLAEQGRLDLHADANRYLRGFQIASTYPVPVTIDQLLTHTAGFDGDQETIAQVARSPAEVLPLGQFLLNHPPRRIQPPGIRYGYSNADYDVLGAVVQDVSGEPFAQYMDEHILAPLRMAHSSFQPPASGPDAPLPGYTWSGSGFRPQPTHYFSDAPSRGLATTAADMARFITFQLPGGTGQTSPVLGAAALRTMQAQHFTYRAGEPGMADGFQESIDWASGERVLWKDGRDDGRATSMLVLLPDRRIGWYVAYNADDGERLAQTIYQQLETHFAPASAPPPPGTAVATAAIDAQRVAGVYREADYSHRTLAKLLVLTWGDYPRVSANADGTLAVRWSDTPTPPPLTETAPLLFTTAPQPNGISHYLFLANQVGAVNGMAVGAETYERVSWYETVRVQEAIFAAFLLIFLAAALSWPARELLRRCSGRQASVRRRPLALRVLSIFIGVIGALDLAFLIGTFLTFQRAFGLGLEYAAPAWLMAILALPCLAGALTVLLAALIGVTWSSAGWSPSSRATVVAFTALALVFIPFLNSWNLLGWRW